MCMKYPMNSYEITIKTMKPCENLMKLHQNTTKSR